MCRAPAIDFRRASAGTAPRLNTLPEKGVCAALVLARVAEAVSTDGGTRTSESPDVSMRKAACVDAPGFDLACPCGNEQTEQRQVPQAAEAGQRASVVGGEPDVAVLTGEA